MRQKERELHAAAMQPRAGTAIALRRRDMRAMQFSRRVALEWALSLVAVAAVAAVIVTINPQAREYVLQFVRSGGTSVGMPQAVAHTSRVVWDLGRDHEALAGFGGVALVLLFFMRQLR